MVNKKQTKTFDEWQWLWIESYDWQKNIPTQYQIDRYTDIDVTSCWGEERERASERLGEKERAGEREQERASERDRAGERARER